MSKKSSYQAHFTLTVGLITNVIGTKSIYTKVKRTNSVRTNAMLPTGHNQLKSKITVIELPKGFSPG